jgi:hypothetical protein
MAEKARPAAAGIFHICECAECDWSGPAGDTVGTAPSCPSCDEPLLNWLDTFAYVGDVVMAHEVSDG